MKKTLAQLFLVLFLILPIFTQAQKNTLQWATYFGGDTVTDGCAMAMDDLGNIYLLGNTFSMGIATKGAYQTEGDSINSSLFLAKFSPSGSLLWATYYGGSEGYYTSPVIDKLGNIWLAGYTNSSSGIATSGAYQSINNNIYNAYLAKFSPSGKLLYGTYFGGNEITICEGGLSTDTSGNIYMVGNTRSASGLATSGAYRTIGDSINGDAFLAKFNNSGSLIWATYYGGNKGSEGNNVVVDDSGYVYLAASTTSDSGIATKGAFQTAIDTGIEGDDFLVKFYPSGTKVLWATYYGGNDGSEFDDEIAIDKEGNVYLASNTNSTSGIATSGAYQTSYAGGVLYLGGDIYIAKFNSGGSLLWATYYGGSGDEEIGDIIVDSFGNILLSGTTSSTLGIATSGAYKTYYSGDDDAFFAKFNSTGSLLYASYYGGKGNDGSTGIIDASGNMYISGLTSSTSGIATSGAYQSTGNGLDWDAFLAKFSFTTYHNDAGIPYFVNPRRNFCMDSQAVKIQLTNYGINTLKSVQIGWEINGIAQTLINWTGSLKTDSAITVALGNYNFSPGTYNIVAWTSAPNGQTDSFPANDTVKITDTVSVFPKADIGNNKTVCFGKSVIIGGTSVVGNAYSWLSKPAGYSSTSSEPSVSPSVKTTYYLTETTPNGGCSKSDSVVITVNPSPDALFSYKIKGYTAKFTPANTTYPGYFWSFGDGTISDSVSPSYTYYYNSIFDLSLTVTDSNGCTASYKTKDTIDYTNISGTKENINNLNANIYPNPSANTFTINLNTKLENANISLYDVMGKQLAGFTLANTQSFNISAADYGMKSGVYILCIHSAGSMYVGKLVVE